MKFVKIDADSNFIALQQFTKPGFANGMYMQDFTASMCNNAPTPTGTDYFLIGTLKDKRDNKQYEVRKFADGKCWMVDDLKFGTCPAASTTIANQTWMTYVGKNASYTQTNMIASNYFGVCLTSINSYGSHLYDWQAVIQSAAVSDNNYQPVQPTQGICPSGWHLPSGGANGEMEALNLAIGQVDGFWLAGGNWQRQAGGMIGLDGLLTQSGTMSSYWSSTPRDGRAYNVHLSNQYAGYVFSGGGTNSDKRDGMAVRCVKDATEPILFGCNNPTSTMQAWHGCSALATPTNTNFTQGPCLMDERDGKTYQVRKFADGKCWMVTNLAYGGDIRSGGVDGCLKTAFNGNTDAVPTNIFGPNTYGDCRYAYDSVSIPDTNKQGYFYNWQAVVQDQQAYFNNNYQPAEPRQGICPVGWFVPMVDDYVELQNTVNGNYANFYAENAAWLSPGFIGGCRSTGEMHNVGLTTFYQTSSQRSDKYGNVAPEQDILERNYDMRYQVNLVYPNTTMYKNEGASVRCVTE